MMDEIDKENIQIEHKSGTVALGVDGLPSIAAPEAEEVDKKSAKVTKDDKNGD